MTLFFLECPSPRITGVTGTKGKTTTTTLIGEIVRAAGRDVVVAGNLRVSALEQLPLIGPQTEVILELSSFQLEGLEAVRLSPATACVTNLMVDHLNRYPTLESYFEAKTHIFRYQDTSGTLVLNRDDPHCRTLAGRAPGRVEWFGATDETPGAAASRLRGDHNRANMAAAAAVARALGIADATTGAAVAAFRGVPYRQELVRERAGVQFVNDSAATTPDALMAALAAAERPVVLIAGGADKELDFTRLGVAALAPDSPLKAAVLLEGSATDKVQQALGTRVAGRFGDLRSALLRATELASPGDVVLLSPGCASFGMFANEFDRGDQYNALVRALD
jgi:UDP-N-acetylmuramoylalanine--D-glutamate ligase